MAALTIHENHVVNGIRLHVAQAGPEAGPPVLLLHGFPEHYDAWRHQLPALAAAGFRVWAADQRGCGSSEKPTGIDSYTLDVLAADVAGLIAAMGDRPVTLVGHDWGGGVAWWTALHYPHLLERLAILNAPHPIAWHDQINSDWRQKAKSWYIAAFQTPRLPEALLSFSNGLILAYLVRLSCKSTTFSKEEWTNLRQAWRQPGAMTAMINWYRALMRRQCKTPSSFRLSIPTLLIWGMRDMGLSNQLAQASIDFCDNGRLVLLEEASHWVQHDEPDEVNRLLLEFLAESPATLLSSHLGKQAG